MNECHYQGYLGIENHQETETDSTRQFLIELVLSTLNAMVSELAYNDDFLLTTKASLYEYPMSKYHTRNTKGSTLIFSKNEVLSAESGIFVYCQTTIKLSLLTF